MDHPARASRGGGVASGASGENRRGDGDERICARWRKNGDGIRGPARAADAEVEKGRATGDKRSRRATAWRRRAGDFAGPDSQSRARRERAELDASRDVDFGGGASRCAKTRRGRRGTRRGGRGCAAGLRRVRLKANAPGARDAGRFSARLVVAAERRGRGSTRRRPRPEAAAARRRRRRNATPRERRASRRRRLGTNRRVARRRQRRVGVAAAEAESAKAAARDAETDLREERAVANRAALAADAAVAAAETACPAANATRRTNARGSRPIWKRASTPPSERRGTRRRAPRRGSALEKTRSALELKNAELKTPRRRRRQRARRRSRRSVAR